MTRAVWIGREVVGVPDDAIVTHPEGDAGIALIAFPTWHVVVVTPSGVIEVPENAERELLEDYFGA